MPIYKFYKNLGETPLECLNRLRIKENLPNDIPITYAGRLDPAATGEMIFLTEEDCKNKDQYTKLDKIYTVEFIFGISTDTSDLLGVIKKYDLDFDKKIITKEKLLSVFNQLTGLRNQNFHNFSSKVVEGKPLWEHSKQGNIKQASHIINIYNIELVNITDIKPSLIYNKIKNLTSLVVGDFRQDEIMKSYLPIKNIENKIPIVTVCVNCSSGTYIRVLADEISQILQIPVCVYSINRDSVIL
jgi:tRNA pseudouridine(55) synthase